MSAMLRRPYFWLGVAISAGALALAVRGLNIGEVADALSEANYLWLVPAVAGLLAALHFRALRWGTLFHPRDVGTGKLFGAMNVGYMLNNLLPLRVGELGRAYVIGETAQVGRVRALTTIVVERLVDLLIVFGLLMLLLPFVDEPDWATGPAVVLGSVVLGASALLAAIGRARALALRLVELVLRFAPARLRDRMRGWSESILDGFAVLGHAPVLLRVGGLSVVAWGFSSLYTYFIMLAFGLDLSYAAPCFVMCAIAMGMVVPSSSGYIGVHHAIAIEALTTVFGVARADAAGFALISHAVFFLIPTGLGMAYLWSLRETWSQVFSRSVAGLEARQP